MRVMATRVADPTAQKPASDVSPTKKRKTLHDYFRGSKSLATSSSSDIHQSRTVAPALRSKTPLCRVQQAPPGLALLPDFITSEEETSLLAFLDAQPWRTDLSRRTMHYGGTYCLMPPRDATPAERDAIASTIITASPIPPEVNFILERMIAAGLYSPYTKPSYCIVNEYLPGQGISAHVENFRFGEPVCSLTLAGSDIMRFHELEEAHDGSVRSGRVKEGKRTGRRADVRLKRRSLCVLRGKARKQWQHEIVRGRKAQGDGEKGWRRVSLTFRTDVKG